MLINLLVDRVKFLFSKDKELYSSLYHITGFHPHNITYYKVALLHKSVSKLTKTGKELNNERLEFLGDAILDASVGDIVFRRFPGKREGFLTTARSKLVQRKTLNNVAEKIGLNRMIITATNAGAQNNNINGNAFEALVGALYLDKGYEACMQFMEKRVFGRQLDIDKMAYKVKNFKSKLIEWCQRNKVEMHFRLLSQTRDGHGNVVFGSVVYLETVKCCDGTGLNKKESEQMASERTLEKLKSNPKFLAQVLSAKAERDKSEEQSNARFEEKVYDEPLYNDVMSHHNKHNANVESAESRDNVVPEVGDAANLMNDSNFDLDDIHVKTDDDMTKDEIIAAAEEAAFTEK